MANVYELQEDTGDINKVASYSISPKKALICYIMQSKGDFNTHQYPSVIEGMKESGNLPGHWYYTDSEQNRILAAFPA